MKHIIFSISLISILAASCVRMNTPIDAEEKNKVSFSIGDTVQKMSKQIWYIFQDSKNNYWFASNGDGVFRFDGETLVNYTEKHGLANDTIRQIQEDKNGNLYFTTMGGITKFDGTKMTTLKAIKNKEWKSEETDMWFFILGKKNEHGPYRYDGENLYNLEFPKHYLHDEFYKNGINPFFSPYEIYTTYKDRKGNMWFGTSVFGACRFDGKSIKWMYEKDLTIVPNGGSFGIRSIFEDKEGSFWICNTQHRYLFDEAKTNQSDRLMYQKSNGIGNEKIFGGNDYIYYSHIVEDNEGFIWLTTWSQGVYKFDPSKEDQEGSITHYSVEENSVLVNLVSMYKDKIGTLWLGTPDHGVFKFNGKTFEKFEL